MRGIAHEALITARRAFVDRPRPLDPERLRLTFDAVLIEDDNEFEAVLQNLDLLPAPARSPP
jgi:hypothetical protein